ncbi:hypothetical protein ACFU6S_29700 [Streptomyces sp. NPDC057456]|uniref:hypothetical protein n=1 Tax=Streptomyces sp. NPDC057456 TaxID=3346139 RepID=UPI0036CC89F8
MRLPLRYDPALAPERNAFHEARHLVYRHLLAEPELREDPVFELAAEVSIDHVALVRTGREELPLLEPPVGQRGARREVQPLARRTPGPQPVEQRGEFGEGAGHHVGHSGEAGRPRARRVLLAHHCASR